MSNEMKLAQPQRFGQGDDIGGRFGNERRRERRPQQRSGGQVLANGRVSGIGKRLRVGAVLRARILGDADEPEAARAWFSGQAAGGLRGCPS